MKPRAGCGLPGTASDRKLRRFMTTSPPTEASHPRPPHAVSPRTARRPRWRVVLPITIVALILVASAWLTRDPRPYFAERHSTLANVSRDAPVTEGDAILERVRLHASSGLAVELTIKRAIADTGRRLPLFLVLGGHRTGRESVKLIGPTPGVVVAGMSYPYGGDPRPEVATFLRDIPKIRRAFLDTPPAAMLALDYLLALDYVDTTRVEAIGVSLGAPFVITTAALHKRVTRVWAMHGSGGSFMPLQTAMKRTIRIAPLRWIAAAISNVIINGPNLAPERWVGMIAPRPFIQINAENDERLPRRSIESMYAAAREPKEMIFVAGAHIKADTGIVRPLVRVVLRRLEAEARAAGTPSP